MSRVYRHTDKIAVTLDGASNTVYITPKEAKSLAVALNKFVKDCRECPERIESTLKTIEVTA